MSAQLFTRAWPVTDVHEAFDRWQLEKHLPDLVQGPGILRAAYYRTVLEGLPEAYHGSGSCMARYTASTLDDLLTWLRSPVVPAAIEDGKRWFGSFNELDGSTYTGNVYSEVAALGPDNPADGEPDLVFVERFEVPPDEAEELDRWLLDRHAPRTAEQPGVARARVFHAERENIPIDYYLSPGNRMLEVDLAPTGSEALLSNGFRELLNDSLAWDLRLPYVKRDVYRFLGRADAERSSPA